MPGRPDGGGPAADAPPAAPAVYLALGVHDHQPVGNFDWVLRTHFEQAYLPFLDAMERHPGVPFSLHISGPLLLWMAEAEPRFLSRLRTLVASERVELKAGGFYEPILAIIPEADAHEQLRRMRCFLEEELGALPTGLWPAERVWEPHLARVLADAGLEYAVLDDSHFHAAGVPHERTHGYYVTEEQGRRFDLFPISKDLRYLIPFREPEDTLSFLRTLAQHWSDERLHGRLAPDAPPPLAVYDDDGEKFGGWPGTHAHVYGAGWLERFLDALEGAVAEGWLGLVTLGEFRRRFPPLGRVYLPTASYAEMLEWSGGFFRNFLVRYDESNLLHKRMLYTGGRVRERLEELGCAPGRPAPSAPCDPAGGDRIEGVRSTVRGTRVGGSRAVDLRDALLAYDHVLQAQCNDALWHGVFGGLYLPHLRDAVTRNLLRAEHLLGNAAGPPVETLDLDLDGHAEVVLRTEELVAIVAPARGGALLSIDHLPSGYALLNTLRRRREPEHAALERLTAAAGEAGGPHAQDAPGEATGGPAAEIVSGAGGPEQATRARTIHETVRMKEPGLERLLFVDRLPRTGFIDRFLPADMPADETLRSLVAATIADIGDFATGVYAVQTLDDKAGALDARRGTLEGRPGILLRRCGTVGAQGVTVEKTVSIDAGADPPTANAIRVDYRVAVHGPEKPTSPGVARFGPELTVNLLAGWEPDRYVLVDGVRPETAALADVSLHRGAATVDLVDGHAGVVVRVSWQAEVAAGGDGPRPVPATLFRYGVVTVSQSEDGFERVYQGTSLLPMWELPLASSTVLTAAMRLEIVGSARPPQAADPPAAHRSRPLAP